MSVPHTRYDKSHLDANPSVYDADILYSDKRWPTLPDYVLFWILCR